MAAVVVVPLHGEAVSDVLAAKAQRRGDAGRPEMAERNEAHAADGPARDGLGPERRRELGRHHFRSTR